MELRPNPFYRPPNRHGEVPQRLSSVRAPPEDLDCQTLKGRILQLRWVFRHLFGKRVEDALIRDTGTAIGKRHRTSTLVAEVANPEKRAKSDLGRDTVGEELAQERAPVQPRDPPVISEPQLQMSAAVRLERFRPLGKAEEMSGVIEGRERVPTPETANPPPSTKSPGSAKKAKSQTSKKSGTAAPGTGPGETGPSSKTKQQRPTPAGEGASDTKFGSARHPRSRTVWERLCRMTDMGTGQLRGSVGTPDNPRLTFEEAV